MASFLIKGSEWGLVQDAHYPLLTALDSTDTTKSVVLAADPATRRLKVEALLAAGSVTIGKVDQGAGGASAAAAPT